MPADVPDRGRRRLRVGGRGRGFARGAPATQVEPRQRLPLLVGGVTRLRYPVCYLECCLSSHAVRSTLSGAAALLALNSEEKKETWGFPGLLVRSKIHQPSFCAA